MSLALTLPASAGFGSGRLPPLASAARRLLGREPALAAMTLALLALMPPTLAAMAFDTRTFHGVDVWLKPFKFQLALAVYLGTLVLFANLLPRAATEGRAHRLFMIAVVTAVTLEMVWIVGSAAAGVGSHFNVSTPLMAVAYPIMGVLAVTLTSASLMQGIAFARDGSGKLAPPLRLSLALGLILTFVLTVIVAGTMSQAGAHWVGGTADDAGGTALFGWSRDGGDLRVAHLFATHAMHALPLLGLVASRTMSTGPALAAVWGGALAWSGLVAFTFLQALAGQPFLAAL